MGTFINESSSKMKGKPSSLLSHLDGLSLIDTRIKDEDDAPSNLDYTRCSSSSTTSKSIPIEYDHLKSQEDWNFRVQEMLADERDYKMFVRIVNGMIARQGSERSSSDGCQSETEKSIARIMRTRYQKLDNKSPTIDNESPTIDDSKIFAYDDQTELTYNGHRHLPRYQSTEDDDQPLDAIFIIDM
jgi:hypothetical protein